MGEKLALGEIVEAIMRGDADENLQAIFDAYSARFKMVRQIRTARMAAELKKGDPVRISNIKPKYLDGLEGKVEAVRSGGRGKPYADVRLPKQEFIGRRMTDLVTGVPLSCLTKLED